MLYFAEVVGENSEDETKALIVDKKKGENPTQHYKTLHVYTDYWL